MVLLHIKMFIQRAILKQLTAKIGQQKVLLLYGTRRTGKTYILKEIQQQYGEKAMLLNGEDFDDQERLKKRTAANYKQLTGKKSLLLIDEAQAVPEVGKILKLIIDSVPDLTIIATGSSSLDLINKTGEPLVGRSYTYMLNPVAQCELEETSLDGYRNLEHRLVFGSYPELWQLPNEKDKIEYLKNLVQSYLLKDIFEYSGIRNAEKIYQLLKLLAFQIGREVSYNELANQLDINKKTVETYLDLLAKVFIIYPLGGYGANLRKEVTKSKKWYFFDNGIRNAIINNFNVPESRNDTGVLWEQYFLSERQKFNYYRQHKPDYFFWRTYDGQEIDFLELDNNGIKAFECKWAKGKAKIPLAFAKNYPTANYVVINKENYWEWIVKEEK